MQPEHAELEKLHRQLSERDAEVEKLKSDLRVAKFTIEQMESETSAHKVYVCAVNAPRVNGPANGAEWGRPRAARRA